MLSLENNKMDKMNPFFDTLVIVMPIHYSILNELIKDKQFVDRGLVPYLPPKKKINDK